MVYNIFICTTPFQVEFSKQIINYCFKGSNYYNFIYSSLPVVYGLGFDELNAVDEIIIADKTNKIKQIIFAYKAIKRIKKLSKHDNVQYFFSHTSGLLANYCYNRYVLKEKKEFNLFYEGVLYFYHFREKKNKQHYLRKLLGIVYGINYKYVEEIVPVNDVRLKKIYTPFPAYTIGPDHKISNIRFMKKELNDEGNNAILLGGLISAESEIKEWKESILKIREHVSYTTLYFKKHPDDNNNVLKSLIDDINMQCNEITSIESVEFLINKYNCKYVFSLQISSALFNLRAIYGSDIELFYSKISDNPNLKRVYEIAQKLDFRML